MNYGAIAFAIFVTPDAVPSLSGGSDASRAMAISQTSFVLLMLCSGFSQIVNVSRQLGDLSGYMTRVGELHSTLVEFHAGRSESTAAVSKGPSITSTEMQPFEQRMETDSAPPLLLELRNLSIAAPDGRLLVHRMRLLFFSHFIFLIFCRTQPCGAFETACYHHGPEWGWQDVAIPRAERAVAQLR